MVAYEPRHDARLVLAEAVFEAEGLRVDRAEFGMISAATLGDVVEQAGEIGDFRLFDRLHDFTALREFVVEARQGEAAQVADDE